ncbi:MAG: electron transporter RnfD [Oscillospiraceae bacterium]
MNKIMPSDKRISYTGRIDFSNADAPTLFYAGSCAAFRFKGTYLAVKLNSVIYWGELSLGAVIDGKQQSVRLYPENNGKDIEVTISDCLEDTVHEVVIYKQHAANQLLTFKGFVIDGELLEPAQKPKLKIEAYGDSVCAGEVIEAADYVGKCDPENHNSRYDNVWNSFVMQTARNLGAELHNICQGGIAIFDGTGYFHHPDYIGLESVYDKLCYFPEGGISQWDFSRYIPDIVIIAVGQNDKHNGRTDSDDINISDPDYRKLWKTAYIKMVRDLDKKYSSPKFVLTTTVLMHDAEWDNAIEEIKNELNEMGIKAYHNLFSRNGAATPGHPRLAEHNEMAEELTAFIKNTLNNA